MSRSRGIERRLAHEAKALGSTGLGSTGLGADDPRTTPQREADLLAAWCTTVDATEAAVHAQIAIKLPADVFTGANDGFAESVDPSTGSGGSGSWSAPASWVLDPQLVANPVWHRLIVDPVTDDVLAHQYVGRLAPDTLKTAAAFRDGVCQAPGCLIPADECDLDHRERAGPPPSGDGAPARPAARQRLTAV